MASFSPDISNKMFGIAVQLVNQSSRSIFLTGKAGTGKTTFLKYIRENCPKQMAVVAPTGVAAINAGGVTIHSLFQLPISPFIPEAKGFSKSEETVNRHSLISRLRMNSDKKKVLQELELLIIDEISMVRCDTLDAVDIVLRHVRNRYQEPFGGVQVLFIGDMFQLPPVIKEQEWNLLAEYYTGPYFFDSLVIQQEQPVYIEFDKIYRQSEERFIRLLNQVRNNNLDEDGMKILESRFNPAFRRTKKDGFIILTTHNEIARQTNAEKLQGLTGKLYSFKADIDDDFPANAYPADELLQLKVGAQVMFIKNDLDKSKRYFNGKIGTVTKLEEEKIIVQCADEPNEIEVKKDRWENIRYDLNKTTRQLEEKLLGAFSQYPLRLAWAITIHKSQGLTFEKAIIDAGKSFAAGQVYVALSRCTSLDGMVLQSRINTDSLRTDQRIVNFSRTAASVSKLEEELIAAQKQYWQKILLSLFDFRNVVANSKELMSCITEHASSFNPEVLPWVGVINGQLISQQEVAERFQQQLQQLFTLNVETRLQERIKAAAEHFYKETESLIGKLQGSPAVTDSRLHAKEYNDLLKEIIIHLAAKKYILEEGGISGIEAYHTRKKSFIAPAISINAYAGASHQQVTDIPHPILYQQLRKKRDAICERKGSPIYMVAGSQTLVEMCTYLPQTAKELEQITGFGPAKIKSYGPDFLDIIAAYCEEHGLESRIDERTVKKVKKEKKEKRSNTKEETYHLFREGNRITEIAKQRNLTPQTIEGHLAFYVTQGEIRIEELLPQEKIRLMEPLTKEFTGGSITAIKEQFGDEVSFGEIRWMLAWQEYLKQQNG